MINYSKVDLETLKLHKEIIDRLLKSGEADGYDSTQYRLIEEELKRRGEN